MPHSEEHSPSTDTPAYPVAYGESRVASALYLIDADVATPHLPTRGVFPVKLGKHALLSISWFDYAASDFGAYRELSVGILVDREPNLLRLSLRALLGKYLSLGAYVLSLPVTSEPARVAGVTRLGLPKTLMALPFTWSKGVLDATAIEGSQRVLSMRLPLGFGPAASVPALVVYSRLGEQLLQTTVKTDFRPQIDLVGRPRLRLEDAAHPLCRQLESLGLPEARCLAVAHGPMQSASLLAPVPVA